MSDTVAYVIENKHLAEENAKLEARIAELEQMVAVLMRHEARDDTIKVQRARIADLRKEADMMHSEYKTAITRINELEAALKPFANVAEEVNADRLCYRDIEIWVAVAHLRAARAALEENIQ